MEIANNERLPLNVLQLDVTGDNSIKEAIGQIYDINNRIDVLINNAGYALAGPLEKTSTEEIKTPFETNFFGAIKTTQLVIPIMRTQKEWENSGYNIHGWKNSHSIGSNLSRYEICIRRAFRMHSV